MRHRRFPGSASRVPIFHSSFIAAPPPSGSAGRRSVEQVRDQIADKDDHRRHHRDAEQQRQVTSKPRRHRRLSKSG